jgi:hypothetical protein
VIGDRVWYDADADGVQDPDEDGIGDISVFLHLDDGDGVFEPEGDDALVAQTTSYGDWTSPNYGYYHFTELAAGHYWVSVGDNGWIMTTPNPHQLIDLQPGEVYLDADFGMYAGGG